MKVFTRAGENWSPYIAVGLEKDSAALDKSGRSFKSLNIDSPYVPAILLLGINPREMKIYIYTKACTQMSYQHYS